LQHIFSPYNINKKKLLSFSKREILYLAWRFKVVVVSFSEALFVKLKD